MENVKNSINDLFVNLEQKISLYDNIAESKYRVSKNLQIVTIVSGLTTTIVASISLLNGPWTLVAKIICVTLPLLAAVAALINSYSKPTEVYILKITGKMDLKTLLVNSRLQFQKCTTSEDYQNLFDSITLKIHEIETSQERKF